MLLERKIYKKLEEWKESLKSKKKALIIKGLRQVGKTTIVKEFCKNNYENVVYFDFMKDKSLHKIFSKDLDVDYLVQNLSSRNRNAKFVPYKTILIFDELQECSNARLAIKPFMLDGRYDIIATGSLIGLRGFNTNPRGVPVGFEVKITMHPLDFEEYLWAIGMNRDILSYLKDCFIKKEKVSEPINDIMMEHFKTYLCVGGMPEAVTTYLDTHDLNQVLAVQQTILDSYKDDFGKHLDKEQKTKTNKTDFARTLEVYNTIPAQLAKENKQFSYTSINKDARAREYRSVITWLEEYGLISLCYNLRSFELPLEGNKRTDAFKIYVADTGLFVAMLEPGTAYNILQGDMKIYKGAIYENVIADAFTKLDKKLYYYKNTFEIDFITHYNYEVTAIEVKAKSGRAKALKELLTNDKYDIKANFKLIDGNIGTQNGINTIPLYMAYLIKD